MGALYVILPIGKPAGQAHPNPGFLQDDRLAPRAGPVCLFFQAWGGPLSGFIHSTNTVECLLCAKAACGPWGRSWTRPKPPTRSERALVLSWGRGRVPVCRDRSCREDLTPPEGRLLANGSLAGGVRGVLPPPRRFSFSEQILLRCPSTPSPLSETTLVPYSRLAVSGPTWQWGARLPARCPKVASPPGFLNGA